MRDPQRVLSTRPERSRVLPIVRTIRPRVLNESLSYVGELITLTNPPTTPMALGVSHFSGFRWSKDGEATPRPELFGPNELPAARRGATRTIPLALSDGEHLVLVLLWHGERRHDDEDEQVVDRQALLDEVAGEVLGAEPAAVLDGERDAEGDRNEDVEHRPRGGLPEADPVRAGGR
jgi:hypothetical protein